MTRQRLILLVIAAVVVIATAVYVTTRREAGGTTTLALLPGLAEDMNAVTAVTMRKGGAAPTLTLHSTGAGWSVAERADYPADVLKLRKLLVSLRDARIVEEKTSDPTLYARLGVQDPADPAAPGAEITVVTPGGKHGVIVGKSAGGGSFVRRVGESRSYGVEPAITLETEPRFWIEARLLDVSTALIQRLDVKPAAGAGYALIRVKPADPGFTLEGVPAGRKALEGAALAPPQSLLTGLDADDVAPAGDVDFSTPTRATATLSDGTVLTLTGAAVKDKHWIQLTSSKDAALTARASGRAFEIASWRYDAIFKPVEQWLEPQPPKPAAASKATPHPVAPPAP